MQAGDIVTVSAECFTAHPSAIDKRVECEIVLLGEERAAVFSSTFGFTVLVDIGYLG